MTDLMEKPPMAHLSVVNEITAQEAAELEPMVKWHATHQIGGVPVMRVCEPDPQPLFKNKVKVVFYDEFGRRVFTNKGRSLMPLDVETVLLPVKACAAAVFACLGAHNGSGLVNDCNYNEGQYVMQDVNGNYVVTCRVYDYKAGGHKKYRLRIPAELEFELVEDREVPEV
jgi:hypothetical protein